MSAAGARATEELRDRLEELRDALLAGDLPEARKQVPRVEAAHRGCRAAYLPEEARPTGQPSGGG
jgi:hypothetical protein